MTWSRWRSAAGALCLAGLAHADGFHSPPFQGVKPEIWEKKLRERLRLPEPKRTQVTGQPEPETPPAPAAPALPPLTTQELGPVVVHLIDLLRYLDPRNVNAAEFPDVAANMAAYRTAVKRLLTDLGPRGLGYLVEALVEELRLRRRGDGRRLPAELLGLQRANRDTWGTTADSDMEAAPDYVDDLILVLRNIGWPALAACLLRKATDPTEEVRADLGRFLLETARRLPRLFLPATTETETPEVRREGLATLVELLTDPARLADDRDLSTRVIEALVGDLRALDEPSRLRAHSGLGALLRQDFGRDQTLWRAYWVGTAPALCRGVAGIPELLERLAGEDGATRAFAAHALASLAGTSQGFADAFWASAAPEARARALARWRDWWEKNRARLEGSK